MSTVLGGSLIFLPKSQMGMTGIARPPDNGTPLGHDSNKFQLEFKARKVACGMVAAWRSIAIAPMHAVVHHVVAWQLCLVLFDETGARLRTPVRFTSGL